MRFISAILSISLVAGAAACGDASSDEAQEGIGDGDGDGETGDGDNDGSPPETSGGSGGAYASGGASATGGDQSSGGDSAGSVGGTVGSGGSASNVPSGTFLMDDDGYVIFEAEDIMGGSPPGDWSVMNDAGPCDDDNCAPSAGAYLQYRSDSIDACGNNGSAKMESSMTVDFQVKTAGFHRFIWRNLRDHRAGDCEHDRNNDSYVTFPEAKNADHLTMPFKVYGGGSGTFTWSGRYDIHGMPHGDVCVDLDAGVTSFELAARSNGHAIDRIAIVYTGSDIGSCTGNGPLSGLEDRPNTGVAP